LQDSVEGLLGGAVACGVAVAGPVKKGAVKLTNSDWVGRETDLSVPVALVNDLEAVALSVPVLTPSDLDWWTPQAPLMGSVLCLGIGTGFGGSLWKNGEVLPMEPGHESLGFFPLLGREVTVEEVVSGTAFRAMKSAGLDAESLVTEGFRMALRRLLERFNPNVVLLMGGVVDGAPELFEGEVAEFCPAAKIAHPNPALLGAARAAIERLSMT
jgi:glucokinase